MWHFVDPPASQQYHKLIEWFLTTRMKLYLKISLRIKIGKKTMMTQKRILEPSVFEYKCNLVLIRFLANQ